MREGLASQIVADDTEVFFPVKGLSLKKVGRKRIINSEIYLNVVRNIHSIRDKDVADELGCSNRTIYRFRKDDNNKDVIVEAEKHIEKMARIGYTRDLDNWDVFYRLPVIQKWYDLLNRRRVKEPRRTSLIRTFWHICKEVRKHPKKIKVEECAILNIKLRDLYYDGVKQPRGLAYECVRNSLRSFFEIVRGISGEYLTNKGISKENLPTYGRYSKQLVERDIRHKFEKNLHDVSNSYDEYLELLNIAKFMYYTGTRITATLSFNFGINSFKFAKDIWMFEVIDKGRGNGKKWEKYFIGHALNEFKEYLSKRFNYPIDKLEELMPEKLETLFPSFINNSGKNRVMEIFKKALIISRIPYKSFQPTHIWRHTFAQEFLRSTDWNYELCAELGGWDSTYVLKKVYGEMGFHPKISGLKRSMGMPIKEETYELRW